MSLKDGEPPSLTHMGQGWGEETKEVNCSWGLSTKCKENDQTPVNTGWYGRQAMTLDTLTKTPMDAALRARKGPTAQGTQVSSEHRLQKITST